MRMRTPLVASAALALGLGLTLVPAASATAAPDTGCMRAGIAFLKDNGLFSTVARDGLPIATAVAVGVTPRAGTHVASLPAPHPRSVVLAHHPPGESTQLV